MRWVSIKVKASSQKHGRCTGLFFFLILCDGNLEEVIKYMILCRKSKRNFIKLFIKERVVHVRQHVDISLWINDYTELTFYQLFRLKKETFQSLLKVLLEHYEQQLIKKSTEEEIIQCNLRNLYWCSSGTYLNRILCLQ
jgi:hypothetical protein